MNSRDCKAAGGGREERLVAALASCIKPRVDRFDKQGTEAAACTVVRKRGSYVCLHVLETFLI